MPDPEAATVTSGTPETDAWLARQRAAFEALAGVPVSAWDGVEMGAPGDVDAVPGP